MKVPEIQWETLETIMEGMKSCGKNPKNLIKMVSEFNLEQPVLSFFLGTLIDNLSQVQKGTSVMLTCSAVIYKALKDAVEASNLEEQFGKKEKGN